MGYPTWQNNISKGPQTKMLYEYVGSKTDLISQRNTKMTHIAARLI